MRRRRTRAVFGLLGTAFVALIWVIYAEINGLLMKDDFEPSDAVLPDLPAPASSPPFFSVPDRASLAVILERPVFSETRRPSGDTGRMRGTRADFALTGVVISASERSALVQPGDGGIIQRLKVGDDVGGWILEEIGLDRIKVRRGADEAEMLIDYAAPAPPTPRTESRKPRSAAKSAANKPAKQVPNQPDDAEVEVLQDTQY